MRSGKRANRGTSILGLVIIGAILAYIVIVGANVVPSVSEYFSIRKVVHTIARDEDSVAGVRAAFDRAADAGYIFSLRGKDLDVRKTDNKMYVGFAYNKEFALGGPAYLLVKYAGSSSGSETMP